jgi:hypothetical protein
MAARQSCAVMECARRSPMAAKSKALAFKLIIAYYKIKSLCYESGVGNPWWKYV